MENWHFEHLLWLRNPFWLHKKDSTMERDKCDVNENITENPGTVITGQLFDKTKSSPTVQERFKLWKSGVKSSYNEPNCVYFAWKYERKQECKTMLLF